MAAHQYTDAEAQAVFGRDMDLVWAYYRNLAERQRPAVQRAAARLQGQPVPEPAPEEPALEDEGEDVELELDSGEDAAADAELEG